MIRVIQNNVGLIFFVKDSFLKFSLKDENIIKGNKKELEEKLVSNINLLEQDTLWITNIDKIPDFLPDNVKNYNFFNVSFKNIIQYYNIENANTKVQFSKLIEFYQKQLAYFREEYPNLSLNIEKIKGLSNFAEAFERSEIKTAIDIDFPWNYSENLELEINKNKDEDSSFALNGFFSYSKMLEIISNIKFPTGGIEIYDIEKKRMDKNSFNKISQKKDFAIVGKVVKSKEYESDIINKNLINDDEEDKIITDFEAEYLLSLFDIIPSKFIFFNESNSLKELVRLPFRLGKYNSYSYDIFCKTIILSIMNNKISILNLWINRFERLYKLDKLILFAERDINVLSGVNFDFQLLLKNNTNKDDEELKNKSKTPFEIKQNKKPIDVLLLESNNFCYLYKDYLQITNSNKKEDK